MAEINEKTVLCPGCPVTGEFVGEVEPESISFIVLQRGSYFRAAAQLTDEYSMTSEASYAAGGHTKHISVAKAQVKILHGGAAESIHDRVKKCVGFTATFSSNSKESRQCPAVNEKVLNHLIQEG